MELKVLVIRSGDPKRLADFYSTFKLVFDYQQHGNSPFHYSTHIGQVLLEIYPLLENQDEADKNLRIGFSIDDFVEIVEKLKSSNVVFAVHPQETEFGFMAVVCDPDGRTVELYKNSS